MSKLEEQLRNSRQQEQPDLKPPVGGWEAIQASLAATAAGVGAGAGTAAAATGEAAAAGTSAGAIGAAGAATTGAGAAVAGTSLLAILLKGTLGLIVLGGIAAGVWSALTNDASTAATPPATETMAAPEALGTDQQQSNNAAAGTTSPSAASTQNDQVITPTSGQGVNGAGVPAGRNTVKPTEVQPGLTPSPGTTPVQSTAPEVPKNASKEEVPYADNGKADPAGPLLPAIIPAEEQLPTAENTIDPAMADNHSTSNAEPDATTGEPANRERLPLDEVPFSTPTPGFTEVTNPTASQGPVAVAPLVSRALEQVTSSEIIFTGFESLSFYGEEKPDEGKFRKYKSPYDPSWQLHGGVNFLAANRSFSFGSSPRFVRTDPGAGQQTFTLPDGEVVNAAFSNSFGLSTGQTNNFMFRFGATRQTAWGGAFRATLGVFSGREKQLDNVSQLAANELTLEFEERMTTVSLEAGFQYTFLRRHRFRPYLGFNGMLFVSHLRIREEFIFDAQTNQRGLVSGTTFDEAGTNIDLSLTVGFQYELSSRISAGAYLWANGGAYVWQEAPFGLEVRYLLK